MENVVKSTAVKRKQNVRKLTALGMLGAISLILVATVHFPIIPAAPFLEYDPADVPILIGTFAFGPVAGFLLTVVVSIIQGMTVSAASGRPHRHHHAHLRYWQLCTDRRQHLPQK